MSDRTNLRLDALRRARVAGVTLYDAEVVSGGPVLAGAHRAGRTGRYWCRWRDETKGDTVTAWTVEAIGRRPVTVEARAALEGLLAAAPRPAAPSAADDDRVGF